MDYKEYWNNNTFQMHTRVKALKHLLTPSLANVNYIRLGSVNDGGYILADDVKKNDYVVSLGVEGNVEFEQAVSAYGCSIDMYDYSIDGLPAPVDNSRFFKKKIGLDYTLSKCIDEAPSQSDVILKIDIEGSEWDVLTEDLSRCRQIIAEMHWMQYLYEDAFYTKVSSALNNIKNTHVPVRIHPNNNVPLMVIGASPVPMVFEVLYLRRDSYTFTEFPEDQFKLLSNKNDPNFPEISLSFP